MSDGGMPMGTSGTIHDMSAVKIGVASATAELERMEKMLREAPAQILPEEKTVPVPIAQYAKMILNMQKLNDIERIVWKAGYIAERPPVCLDDDDALAAIGAILEGGNQ